jgi:hypothetical protein
MSTVFEAVPDQPAKPGDTWKLVRALMWAGIALFAVVKFLAARSDLEPGFLSDPSAPQVAQVWAEYIAQVMLAVTVGLAATFAVGFKAG